jgi:hypothetical protein
VTDPVRLGGGQGFYGDAVDPLPALAAEVDYVVLEALAELTLAILQKDRQRDERLGYARDLEAHVGALLPALAEGRTRVITNAGGLNPLAAARAVEALGRSAGVPLRVATVVGDDLVPIAGELFEGAPPSDLRFFNAYLGAQPIVAALEHDVDVVVTGRVADAALFLAPLVHEHGWAWDDWDRLASGTVVGHLLECSGQATGGNLSWRWWEVDDPWALPFPTAAVDADGRAVIGKVAGSGGRVGVDTVREQLLYEVHDPSRYLAPDVVADFASVSLRQLDGGHVEVSPARGLPAPTHYKALACEPAGWSGDAMAGFGWPDAVEKARAFALLLRRRAERAGLDVQEWHVEHWGAGALLGDGSSDGEPPEVAVRVAWRCADRTTAERVGRMVPPLYTSGPMPGLTTAGRAFRFDASEMLRSTVHLVPRAVVDENVRVLLGSHEPA